MSDEQAALELDAAAAMCQRILPNEKAAWKLADELETVGYVVRRLSSPVIIRRQRIGKIGIVESSDRAPDRKRWVGDLQYQLPANELGS